MVWDARALQMCVAGQCLVVSNAPLLQQDFGLAPEVLATARPGCPTRISLAGDPGYAGSILRAPIDVAPTPLLMFDFHEEGPK